jgi:hypothetical protein
MNWPWVSRRAFDEVKSSLDEARKEIHQLRETNSHIIDRNLALTDPYSFLQVRMALKEQAERNEVLWKRQRGEELTPAQEEVVERELFEGQNIAGKI